jgi:diguanylate cyclase (GGDEF)-like protein
MPILEPMIISAEDALLQATTNERDLTSVVARAHSRANLRMSVLADSEFRIQWMSENALALLRRDPASFVGTIATDHVHPDDVEAIAETLVYELNIDSAAVRPQNVRIVRDIRIASATGEWVLFEAYVSNMLDDPEVAMFLIDLQVPSQHHLVDQAVEAAWISEDASAILEAILGRLTRGGAGEVAALVTVNGDDRIVARSVNFDTSASFVEAVAAQPATVAHWTKSIRLEENSAEFGVLHVWSPNDQAHPVDVEMSERVAHQAALALSRAALRSELADAAFLDPLTGVGNRRSLQRELTRIARTGEPVMLAYLDLDGFKAINDDFGHPAGDDLLIGIANRLSESMRPDDLVIRLGGDEFAILFTGSLPDPQTISARIEMVVSMPIFHEGRALTVSTSVGIATGLLSGPNLLAAADRAMFEMKQARRTERAKQPVLG